MSNVCSYANVTGKKAVSVDKLIDLAVASGKTMRERVQQAVVGIAYHAQKHNDPNTAKEWANRLVNELGNGVNAHTLITFMTKHLGLVVGQETTIDEKTGKEKKVDCFVDWKGGQHIRENWEDIKSKPWWEASQAKPWAGFNLEEELAKLLQRANNANVKAEKLRKEGKDEEAAKVDAPIEVIRAVQAAMQAA